MSKRIYLSPPHMGPQERELLLDAFDSNWIAPLGPHVDAFEREFAAAVGVPHAAALSSGTAALHLALVLLGVKPGDEVVTSSFTFAATTNAIRYVGATPVFIDSDLASWNMDPALLNEELATAADHGCLPKAAVVVDLYGQCADYERIRASCEHYGVPIIEDAAEALGATYKGRPAGSFGDLSVFSFNGNKIITTSGGGMLVAQDAEWITRARSLASQAREPVAHYEHVRIGYNYRLSNLLAAVGRGQLGHLADRVERRRMNRNYYREQLGSLPGVAFMPEAPDCESTFWLTCITINPEQASATTEQVRLALEEENIEARPVWKPMHLQPVFKHHRIRGGKVCEQLFETGLCLPSGSSLSDRERDRVANIVAKTLR